MWFSSYSFMDYEFLPIIYVVINTLMIKPLNLVNMDTKKFLIDPNYNGIETKN